VNILGYDPIWRSRDKARFQGKYFHVLSQAGFNSVRINLYPFRQMDASNNSALRTSWLEVLDWAVAEAQKEKLMIVLDLHEYEGMGKDPAGNKEKFLAAWRQLSDHFKSAPDAVLFEVLNEPSRQLTPALWNEYFGDALALIRKSNPSRTVIVGPAFWNSLDHLRELELPATDTNLIVTVHYYTPMDFTHQGAAWVNREGKLGVEWQGTEQDLGLIKTNFEKVTKWAEEHHRPIFLGEFGAYDKAPIASRVRYLSSISRAAEQRGWSWAYWQFDGDFILYDVPRDAWVMPILQALIPAH
jgi:endoglucanase